MKAVLNILRTAFLYILLCIATFLMARIIIQYAGFDDQAAFLKVKQEYLHITIWKVAFYVHVFSSILS